MFQKITCSLSVLVLISALQSCSSGGDTITTTEGDTTKHITSANFSNMSVNIAWVIDQFPMVQFSIDSAGHSLSILPGDTLWYISNGRRFGVHRNTANWYDQLIEVVDSGAYEFHFQRRIGGDTLTATCTLALKPFHISAPAPGSHVFLGSGVNDTIVYEPAGGKELWLLYLDRDQRPIDWLENAEPDNGKYILVKDGASDGYVQLLRHFVGNLSSPGPFKSVHYDYWQKSKPLALSF